MIEFVASLVFLHLFYESIFILRQYNKKGNAFNVSMNTSVRLNSSRGIKSVRLFVFAYTTLTF